MADRPVLIISGTNRPASNTLKVARALAGHYERESIAVDFFDLAHLPAEVFLPTVYGAKPESFKPIQQRVYHAAGLHIVMPEYNGSFPGILKYFIDLLKFPESFEHKPVAFVGLANGMFGALRAVEQMQMVFAYRNAHLFPDRVFIPGVKNVLGSAGEVTDPAIDERLHRQSTHFAKSAGLLAR